MPPGATPTRLLNTAWDGDSTSSLGSLFQCSINLVVKKFFLPFALVFREHDTTGCQGSTSTGTERRGEREAEGRGGRERGKVRGEEREGLKREGRKGEREDGGDGAAGGARVPRLGGLRSAQLAPHGQEVLPLLGRGWPLVAAAPSTGQQHNVQIAAVIHTRIHSL